MPDFQPELLKRMFVNLHTIKGTARSLYLRSLTDHIHALEQAIQNDLRNPEQFQKNALAAGLAGIEEGLNLYVDLARKKLGIDLYQQDRIDFDRKEILESLERIEDSLKRSSPSLQDLKRLLQEQQRRFYTRIYADLRATLQGLDIVVRTVAQELEKTVPTLILDVPMNAALTLEGEELLQSIFGHILRNAVDHGIESDTDRIRAGKPLRGQLEISVSLADDAVTFVVSDDGRGLDLGAVRSKAENLGMIPKGGTLPAPQLAELIFAPGVSTKEQVTLISGRGVGMDAVRTYLREKGGDISLHLKDDRHPEMNCRYFYLTISIPRQLFRFMDEQSIARAS
jgi:chemotaxis protein histidine kinase CheA